MIDERCRGSILFNVPLVGFLQPWCGAVQRAARGGAVDTTLGRHGDVGTAAPRSFRDHSSGSGGVGAGMVPSGARQHSNPMATPTLVRV